MTRNSKEDLMHSTSRYWSVRFRNSGGSCVAQAVGLATSFPQNGVVPGGRAPLA
jgi:hypothetical protein